MDSIPESSPCWWAPESIASTDWGRPRLELSRSRGGLLFEPPFGPFKKAVSNLLSTDVVADVGGDEVVVVGDEV